MRVRVAAVLSVLALTILLVTPWGFAASILALVAMTLVWGQHRHTEGETNE